MNIKLLLSVLIVFTMFSACKKCKDCTCTQVISQTDMSDFTSQFTENNVCDEDLDEIEGTITFTQTVDGFEQSVEQTCECN